MTSMGFRVSNVVPNLKEVRTMTITTNTTDRKALAKAIAEELGTTAR